MSDLDLERLGDVWRQPPDPAELEELKRAAEAVRRRARWVQLVDVVAAVAVAGVVLLLVLSNPATDTFVVGGGAILLLLVSQIRSRRLRQKELASLSGSAEEMLDQSIERVRATLKRTRSTLIWTPPGIVIGIVVTFLAERRSGGEFARRIAEQEGLGVVLQVAAIVALAAGVLVLVRSLRQNRRELDRLLALRQSYREEQESGGG